MTNIVIRQARDFDSKVSRTVMEEASKVAKSGAKHYAECKPADAGEAAASIVEGLPDGSRDARKSEWKAFIMAAGNYNLVAALAAVKADKQVLTRVQLFKLCRLLRNETPANAIKQVFAARKGVKSGSRKANQPTFNEIVQMLVDTSPRSKAQKAFHKQALALVTKCKLNGVNLPE
jgi:hypothetical protein